MWKRISAHCLGGVLLIFSLPLSAHAVPAVQFIDGLWLDSNPIYQHETTRIYVALRNAAETAITGTVTIRANDTTLPERAITALPGRLIESWVDWTPQVVGSTTITAILHNVQLDDPLGTIPLPEHTATLKKHVMVIPPEPEPILPLASTTASSTRVAELADPIATRLPRWYSTTHQTLLNQIEQTHQDLLDYEQQLNKTITASTNPTSHSTSTATTTVSEPITTSRTAATTSFMTKATDWLGTNLLIAQLWLIRSVRWLFGYPALLQLFTLLSFLWLIYRTARYFGKR